MTANSRTSPGRARATFLSWIGIFFLIATGWLPTGLLSSPNLLCADELTSADFTVRVMLLHEAMVSPREEGLVTRISVSELDAVEEGELLVQLDDRAAVLKLEKIRSELELAQQRATDPTDVDGTRAILDIKKGKFAQAQRIFKQGGMQDADYLELELEYRLAELEHKRALREQRLAKIQADTKQAELKLAQDEVDRHRILAPINGVVREIQCRVGERVDTRTPVIHLIQLDELRAESRLAASQMPGDLLGRPFEVEAQRLSDGGKVKAKGRITYVDPVIERSDGQVRVRGVIDNSQRILVPGMIGRMTFPGRSGR